MGGVGGNLDIRFSDFLKMKMILFKLNHHVLLFYTYPLLGEGRGYGKSTLCTLIRMMKKMDYP